MLYRTLKRLIERGSVDGIAEKLELFYAADRLTRDEYLTLAGMLPES